MHIGRLAQHSAIYSIAAILVQAVNLLMIPVFTRNLTTEQFGEYNLLIAAQTLLSIFITVAIASGLNRFIYEFKDHNRTKNIVLTFSMIWGLAICILTAVWGTDIYHFIIRNAAFSGHGYINYLVFSAVLLGLTSVYIAYYTMQMKPKIVSTINFSRVLILLGFSAYFLIVEKAGVYGALQAQFCTYVVITIGLFWYDRKTFKPVLSWYELRTMLKYSFGLIPGQASAWVYTLIDRYFLSAMLGLKQVAIYSMGYRIGMLMEPVLISPFKSVFTAYKFKVYKEPDAVEKFRKFYTYYCFAGLFCVLGFAVFAKSAILVLSTPEYTDAFKVVPLIVFSYFLYGLGEFYSLGIHLENKSYLDSFILVIGGVCNITFNLLLIPHFGIMGAAGATIISYFLMNIITYVIGKKYYDCGLGYFAPLKGTVLVVIIYLIYLSVNGVINSIILEMLFATFLCAAYLAAGVVIGLLPSDTTQMIVRKIVKPFL